MPLSIQTKNVTLDFHDRRTPEQRQSDHGRAGQVLNGSDFTPEPAFHMAKFTKVDHAPNWIVLDSNYDLHIAAGTLTDNTPKVPGHPVGHTHEAGLIPASAKFETTPNEMGFAQSHVPYPGSSDLPFNPPVHVGQSIPPSDVKTPAPLVVPVLPPVDPKAPVLTKTVTVSESDSATVVVPDKPKDPKVK